MVIVLWMRVLAEAEKMGLYEGELVAVLCPRRSQARFLGFLCGLVPG